MSNAEWLSLHTQSKTYTKQFMYPFFKLNEKGSIIMFQNNVVVNYLLVVYVSGLRFFIVIHFQS